MVVGPLLGLNKEELGSQEASPKESDPSRDNGSNFKSIQQGTTTPTIMEGGHCFKKLGDLVR